MIDKKAKSALSLRLFGEDITVAAKDASKKREHATSAATPVATADAEGNKESMQVEAGESLAST